MSKKPRWTAKAAIDPDDDTKLNVTIELELPQPLDVVHLEMDMGQYYYVMNLDKKQYLHPHKFDDGLKLMEFGQSGGGTMLGLAILLADGNGRGGGDLNSNDQLVGSWAGDRIVIGGDYADDGKFLPMDELTGQATGGNLHHHACDFYEDISPKVVQVLKDAGEWLRGSS